MIKVEDFRIGNVVNKGVITSFPMGTTHSEWEVTCDWGDYKFSDLEPIKLTEDILLKCGFEKDDETSEFTIFGSTFTIIKLRNGINNRERFELLSHDFNPKLDYLHELQNTYRWNTNNELNIQL